ncbi:phenylalanine--tRNA ligase subunit alpha [bacterium]|nr:phenylalanine--tRNA ligase subunit alpha [bacterium]
MESIERIKESALQKIDGAKKIEELDQIRVAYIGKKGEITLAVKSISCLSQEERPKIGALINKVKAEIETALAKKSVFSIKDEWFDETLPPLPVRLGKKHPITQVREEIVGIFSQMGFSIEQGPEIEETEYNFDLLNIPPDHPARDMHDTFYINDHLVLRTHTSPVQIRVMKKRKPPIRIIVPGRVYRRDADVSHSPMFHQVEGLLVDVGIRFSDLKGTLACFLHQMFGRGTPVRFRPSYFPFTEPSAEIDIGCILCQNKGCRVCKNTGWLEILGAGLVSPAVLLNVGIDAEEYTGFAFGLGVERIAMLKFGISDIRAFFTNDLRFLNQF